jgi:hypothetical protein
MAALTRMVPQIQKKKSAQCSSGITGEIRPTPTAYAKSKMALYDQLCIADSFLIGETSGEGFYKTRRESMGKWLASTSRCKRRHEGYMETMRSQDANAIFVGGGHCSTKNV